MIVAVVVVEGLVVAGADCVVIVVVAVVGDCAVGSVAMIVSNTSVVEWGHQHHHCLKMFAMYCCY